MTRSAVGLAMVAVVVVTPACTAEDVASMPAPPTGTVVGTVVSVDDVGERTRTPVVDATLAILPVGEAVPLWEAVGLREPPADPSTVGGVVDADLLAGATLAPVRAGEFGASPPDGDHLVCLLDGEDPYSLRGCDRVIVDGAATWSVSHGEGGVAVASD